MAGWTSGKGRMRGRIKAAVCCLLTSLAVLAMAGAVWAGEWKQEKRGWRYYRDDGSYVKLEWLQDEDGRWYYFDDFGYIETGWVFYEKNRYYLDEDGVMQTGWMQIDGKYYYFYESGAMAFDTITPDGYSVDRDGARIEYPWLHPDLTGTEFFGDWLFAPTEVKQEEGRFRVKGLVCDNGYDTEERLASLSPGVHVWLPWTGGYGEVQGSVRLYDRTIVTVRDKCGSQFSLSCAGMSVIWGDAAGYEEEALHRFNQGQRSSLYLVRQKEAELVTTSETQIHFGRGAGCPQDLASLLGRCETLNQAQLKNQGLNATNHYEFLNVRLDGVRIVYLKDWEANYDLGVVY